MPNIPGFTTSLEDVVDPLWKDINAMPDYGDYVTNRLIALEKYQKALGLVPKDSTKPLVCATMKTGTNPITGSALAATYEVLIKNRVPELTNMTLYQLMELPTYELKTLLATIKGIHEKEKAAAAAAEKQKNKKVKRR